MKEKNGGDLLIALRESQGVSASKLAKDLGAHRNTIFFWERGKKIPSPQNIFKLAKYFGVSSDRLFFSWRKIPDDIESRLIRIPRAWREIRELLKQHEKGEK